MPTAESGGSFLGWLWNDAVKVIVGMLGILIEAISLVADFAENAVFVWKLIGRGELLIADEQVNLSGKCLDIFK